MIDTIVGGTVLLSPDESLLAPSGLISSVLSNSVFASAFVMWGLPASAVVVSASVNSVLAASAVLDSAFVSSVLAMSAAASEFALSDGSADLAMTESTWDVGSGASAKERSGRSGEATGAGGRLIVKWVSNGSAVPGSLGAMGVALLNSSGGVPLGDSKIGSRLT